MNTPSSRVFFFLWEASCRHPVVRGERPIGGPGGKEKEELLTRLTNGVNSVISVIIMGVNYGITNDWGTNKKKEKRGGWRSRAHWGE